MPLAPCFAATSPNVASAPNDSADARLKHLSVSDPNLVQEYRRWGEQRQLPPVPAIMHQSWSSCELPDDHDRWRRRCSFVQPGWSLRLYTDSANRELIEKHFPSFLSLYDNYDLHIKRVDAARLFYLYLYGGIYIDLDMICLRPFDALPLAPGEASFGYSATAKWSVQCCKQDAQQCANGTCVTRGGDGVVPNAFMAAPPRHPLIAHLILGLHHSRNTTYLGKPGPHAATGPVYLSNRLHDWVHGLGRGHVRVHAAPRIYTSGRSIHSPAYATLGSRYHKTSHPCSFEGPLVEQKALVARKCNRTRYRLGPEYSPDECADVRAWSALLKREAELVGTESISPDNLTCAKRLPDSFTTTFWTATWVKQMKNELRVPHKAVGP